MGTKIVQAKCRTCKAGSEQYEDYDGKMEPNRIWIEIEENIKTIAGWMPWKKCPRCGKRSMFKV